MLRENKGKGFKFADEEIEKSEDRPAVPVAVVVDAPKPSNLPGLSKFKPRVVPGLPTMFWQTFKRAWIQHGRSKKAFLIDNLLVLIAAMLLSVISYGTPVFLAPQPIEVRL